MAGIFVKSTLALSVSLALGTVAQAAYLGQLKVQSNPAQNFVATVQVHDVDSTTKSLLAKLAPKATYDQFKVTMPQSAQGLSMALVSKNPLTLKISGKRPAQEQAFPLLLELHEGDQIKVRQYNIRLGATGSVEPTAPVVKTVPPAVVDVPIEKSAVEAPKAQAVKKVASAAVKDEKAMTPLERMKAKGYDLSKPITIEEGYTPWSLGVLYQSRYPGATVNQVLVALAVHNAEAFPHGNVRQLKTGAKLSAPPASLVQSINRQTAHEIVQKGLNIQDVAQRPMPIAKEKPVAKKPTKPAPAPAPVVEPVKAPEPVVEKVEPKVEEKPIEAAPVASVESVAQPAPVEQVPAVPVTTPEPAVKEQPAPTLEIMTEEEAKPEEESSSWYWWLLLVALLGAGGFVFWRTKQGKKVDFESLKKAMQEKGKPRKEPVASRVVEPSIVTSTTAVQMKPVEPSVVHEEPTFLQPTPEVKAEAKLEPKSEPITAPVPQVEPSKVSLHEDAFNVFDLVSEDATEPMKEPVKPVSAPAVAKPNVVQTPKFEQSMNDTLEMARSFISINSHNEAIMLLQEVLQSGTPSERQTAQTLLDQIRQQQ